MADITPEEVVEHIVNSLDAYSANVYTDDLGCEWYVRSEGSTLIVEITDPSNKDQVWRLVPQKN